MFEIAMESAGSLVVLGRLQTGIVVIYDDAGRLQLLDRHSAIMNDALMLVVVAQLIDLLLNFGDAFLAVSVHQTYLGSLLLIYFHIISVKNLVDGVQGSASRVEERIGIKEVCGRQVLVLLSFTAPEIE